MTPHQQWISLAKRCEQSIWSDRTIDFDIFQLLGGDAWNYACENVRQFGKPYSDDDVVAKTRQYAGRYTGSPNEIISLIEQEFPDARSTSAFGCNMPARASIAMRGAITYSTQADTLPLALCAVFCRAMANKVLAPAGPWLTRASSDE